MSIQPNPSLGIATEEEKNASLLAALKTERQQAKNAKDDERVKQIAEQLKHVAAHADGTPSDSQTRLRTPADAQTRTPMVTENVEVGDPTDKSDKSADLKITAPASPEKAAEIKANTPATDKSAETKVITPATDKSAEIKVTTPAATIKASKAGR